MKILFILYYFEPYKGVGARRTSYWVKNIKKLDKYIDYDVVTAIKQDEKTTNIHYAEDNQKSIWSFMIKDEGITWIKSLKLFFKDKDLTKYDVVLISGGPFMHFSIAKYIKQKSNAKVILDFRDPFYHNPRFKSSFIKDSIKKYFQDQFLKYTDLVITVNKYCKDLIGFENIKLIDNGFDMSNFKIDNSCGLKNNLINLISIGRVDDDINLNYFFEVLKDNPKYKFNYVGDKIFDDKYKEVILYLGFRSYNQTLNYVNNSDICILFTSGKEFESTTKIFDYLAFNKKILIITEGIIKTGALYDITKGYPNIEWVNNKNNEIRMGLDKLATQENIKFDTSIYSRKNGLKNLIKAIDELLS